MDFLLYITHVILAGTCLVGMWRRYARRHKIYKNLISQMQLMSDRSVWQNSLWGIEVPRSCAVFWMRFPDVNQVVRQCLQHEFDALQSSFATCAQFILKIFLLTSVIVYFLTLASSPPRAYNALVLVVALAQWGVWRWRFESVVKPFNAADGASDYAKAFRAVVPLRCKMSFTTWPSMEESLQREQMSGRSEWQLRMQTIRRSLEKRSALMRGLEQRVRSGLFFWELLFILPQLLMLLDVLSTGVSDVQVTGENLPS